MPLICNQRKRAHDAKSQITVHHSPHQQNTKFPENYWKITGASGSSWTAENPLFRRLQQLPGASDDQAGTWCRGLASWRLPGAPGSSWRGSFQLSRSIQAARKIRVLLMRAKGVQKKPKPKSNTAGSSQSAGSSQAAVDSSQWRESRVRRSATVCRFFGAYCVPDN